MKRLAGILIAVSSIINTSQLAALAVNTRRLRAGIACMRDGLGLVILGSLVDGVTDGIPETGEHQVWLIASSSARNGLRWGGGLIMLNGLYLCATSIDYKPFQKQTQFARANRIRGYANAIHHSLSEADSNYRY